jgi:hypothetical protein
MHVQYSNTLRLFGYQPNFKKSKTDPVAGIAMGAIAVLPSNKCGAHETFPDWSISSYTAASVVPSVTRASLWAFSGVSEGKIGRKSAQNVQRNAREMASTISE